MGYLFPARVAAISPYVLPTIRQIHAFTLYSILGGNCIESRGHRVKKRGERTLSRSEEWLNDEAILTSPARVGGRASRDMTVSIQGFI
jgi:hypothetical protein